MPEPGRLRGIRTDPRRLIGRWQFERTLIDLTSGEQGSATGTLTISTADVGLRWTEQGELSWSGTRVPVSRELRLVPTDEPEEWLMTFADGRPFHPWKPGYVVQHPCGPDLYRGKIDVTDVTDDIAAEALRIEWTVRGPRKDHRYLTTCRRIPAAVDQPAEHATA